MGFRRLQGLRANYCWYIFPYNVVHVLVVIVIDILVPSCAMPSGFSNSEVRPQAGFPRRPTLQITADFLIRKSRHAGGAIPSNWPDGFRRSMTDLVDCSPR